MNELGTGFRRQAAAKMAAGKRAELLPPVLASLRGPRRGARLAPAAPGELHAHIPSSAMTNSPPGELAALPVESILRQLAGLAEANTGATKIPLDDAYDNGNAGDS